MLVHNLLGQRQIWLEAMQWLETHRFMPYIVSLLDIPWEHKLLELKYGWTFNLAQYLSDDWLNDCHINQMVAYLRTQLPHNHVILEDADWSHTLIAAYEKRERVAEPLAGYSGLHDLAEHMRGGSVPKMKLAFPIFVATASSGSKLPLRGMEGNHWVSVGIDLNKSIILYGDSLGKQSPKQLTDVLDWFLSQVFGNRAFTFGSLPCGTQSDSTSCALYALEAIAHFAMPQQFPINENLNPVVTRKRWFENATALQPAATSSAVTVKTKPLVPTAKKSAIKNQVRLRDNKPSKEIHPLFQPQPTHNTEPSKDASSKPKRKILDVEAGDDDEDKSNQDNDEEKDGDLGNVAKPGELIPLHSRNAPKSTGAPKKKLLDDLTWPCYKPSDPAKILHKCIAKHLPTDLKDQAKAQAKLKAPSARLEELSGTAGGVTNGEEAGETKEEPASKKPKMMQEFTNRGSKAKQKVRHAQLDLDCTILFSTLPSNLANSIHFKNLLNHADPTYEVPTREKLDEELTPGEAENVLAKQLELLKNDHFLTVSFDGGTKKGESHYTLHISNPERDIYLMETRNATDESHTGEWIKVLAMKWINEVGPARFAASCSDSTGNTLLARHLIVDAVPTILSIADCCHHLDNMNKDIVKLTYFQEPITVIRGTIKSFSQSHVGKSELEKA
ncbi:hypothetical protein D9758_018991 [Tetrapyrgos nigripes]|uniref:Ubiquitin-like protease family profile domain-containing protein n=1 Tax=Tetrapyrgos nigripes TaxID=182062 RepID=A0A8H5ERQ7_9AGAR|nr:hypothetical protein D9758_018991 [Tetrapyrgos nigripes]